MFIDVGCVSFLPFLLAGMRVNMCWIVSGLCNMADTSTSLKTIFKMERILSLFLSIFYYVNSVKFLRLRDKFSLYPDRYNKWKTVRHTWQMVCICNINVFLKIQILMLSMLHSYEKKCLSIAFFMNLNLKFNKNK